jgi:hypothetical protein
MNVRRNRTRIKLIRELRVVSVGRANRLAEIHATIIPQENELTQIETSDAVPGFTGRRSKVVYLLTPFPPPLSSALGYVTILKNLLRLRARTNCPGHQREADERND